MPIINCPECNKEVSDKAPACPNCGFPFAINDAPPMTIAEEIPTNTDLNNTEAYEPSTVATAVLQTEPDESESNSEESVKKQKISKKTKIIALAATGVVIIIGVLAAILISNASIQAKYLDNMQSARMKMLGGAAISESICNLTRDVWYNTIYEKSDSETDKFTKNGYKFNEDFNDSISQFYKDVDTKSKIESIEANRDLVASLMKALKNPPSKYEESYEALKDMYYAYYELTELALSPSGNYNTYSENINNTDSEFGQLYDKTGLYIPAK